MAVFIADPGGLVPTTSHQPTKIEPDPQPHEPDDADRPPEAADTERVRQSTAQ
jgi:hypothetical protein